MIILDTSTQMEASAKSASNDGLVVIGAADGDGEMGPKCSGLRRGFVTGL
jgi:hypothetical protein